MGRRFWPLLLGIVVSLPLIVGMGLAVYGAAPGFGIIAAYAVAVLGYVALRRRERRAENERADAST